LSRELTQVKFKTLRACLKSHRFMSLRGAKRRGNPAGIKTRSHRKG